MGATGRAELAYRRNGGIEVSLLWDRRTGALTVCVFDSVSGEGFHVPAAPNEALEVFHHPYAHAAFKGMDFESRMPSKVLAS